MTRPQQPRIDLNHGYFKFIRRNQVDRDEFNRIHEQRKSEIRERLGERVRQEEEEEEKAPKPTNLYIPPHLRPKLAATVAARPTLYRSDSSDSQDDEKPCPMREKQRIDEEHIRHQVRRRIERTHPTVDDICVSLENYRIQEAERSIGRNGETNLFTFELTLKSGDVKTINVPRNTQAARLAKSISREHSFDDAQCRNLRLYLEEQLETRLALEEEKRRRRMESPSSTASSTTSSSSSSSTSSSLPTSPCSSSSSSSTSSTAPFSV